jgi:Fe-S cluster assembly protein SufD
MPQNQDKSSYLSVFREFESGLNGQSQNPVHGLRTSAIKQFESLGFPTTRDEDWIHTNVAPLTKLTFGRPSETDIEDLASPVPDLGCPTLVFVNGKFSANRSSALDTLPEGVTATSLREAIDSGNKQIIGHLAQHARYDTNTFTALNTAFIDDGALIHVPVGKIVETPIHLLFISSGTQTISHPRVLLVAEDNAQVTVIETYVGTGNYFTNSVTELVAGDNTVVDHYKLGLEDAEAYHIAAMQTCQGANSNVSTHSVSLGGLLVRNEVNAKLAGEGCEATVNGFYLLEENQHLDNHTLIEHAQPNCTSHELYKGILGGSSQGVFRGKIHVHKIAQKTDAFQTNQNLLVSENANANAKPQLEIYADDVKCSHGVTIGQLDEDAIFYLRARGIGKENARNLLVHAFANDIINRVKVDPIRKHLEGLVMNKFGNLAKTALDS